MQQAPGFGLEGRVVVITGGSRGLGRAMASGFAAAGATVVVASRDVESCEVAAVELEQETGREAYAARYHAGEWGESETLVLDVESRVGPIDVLVNNAGMSPLYDSVTDVSEALFDKVVAVNLRGPFRLTALVGEAMAKRGHGSIINISSMGAVRPRPHIIPYSAAKAGLNAMTVGFAHAYGPAVRVNAIMAGTFLTDVSQSWDAEVFARRAETFALGRGGQPDEIVGAALYLASDLSSYTTGAVLQVDGGQP
ncbi:SDR family NAD(P)-dependent oxidoreductase [Nocardioides sediminis]|uniref:SDR family NAD(P)-dependent oxidoreductase n=1 Tax=Nocardioides sediminis TaxID=433648 RepID=UPI000D30F366|nr:glucose 1-dehydrogenase [Nocardioides sediminis]